jgi:quinol-cytochrome oxidoreductase complex cytochrome b subunit
MEDNKTHPWFPDQVWPYSVLAMALLVMLGLFAYFGRPALEPGQAADPRAAIIPRPEWYFLALFQFAKLGPALLTTMLIPAALLVGVILWPVIDAWLGPRLARRLGWRMWPAPKRNPITGTVWIAGLSLLGILTLWAVFAPQLCVAWPFNGPVCGG